MTCLSTFLPTAEPWSKEFFHISSRARRSSSVAAFHPSVPALVLTEAMPRRAQVRLWHQTDQQQQAFVHLGRGLVEAAFVAGIGRDRVHQRLGEAHKVGRRDGFDAETGA